PGFGSISSTGDNHAYWTAPEEATEGKIRVLVSNGRGGLAHSGILMNVGSVELGAGAVEPPAYALQVVTDGMDPNREYIPPYSGYVKGQNRASFLTERTNSGAIAEDYYKVVVGADYQTPGRCGNG